MRLSHVWEISGLNPDGPVTCVFGGVHGDEVVGIEVIKKLLNLFGLTEAGHGYEYTSPLISKGKLYIGIGNPVAVEKCTRAAENGPDLNRSFSLSELRAEPTSEDRYDLRRARALFTLFTQTDYLFDIHSTSSPSIPFICMGNDSTEHHDLYSLIPADYVLTDPDTILPKDYNKAELGTTDYAVNTFGGSEWSIQKYGSKRGVAMCYESGWAKELSQVDKVFDVVLRLLFEVGTVNLSILSKEAIALQKSPKKVFKLSKIIKAEGSDFIFNDNYINGWVSVTKGDVLGRYTSTQVDVTSPSTGMVIFQKGGEIKIGDSLCYIAEQI